MTGPDDSRDAWWNDRRLIAIVALAAALRFYPLWFGLPYPEARPDEETSVGKAAAMLGGDLNPHFFHWPSLTFYVFAGAYAVATPLVGQNAQLTAAQQVLIGRGIVALAGTLTVIVLYGIGRRTAGNIAGLLAALFLAVATLHVRDSHFAMTDVLMTLFVMLSLLALLRADASDDRRWFLAAGLLAGLAASTKYSAAAVVAAMAVVQLRRAFWDAPPWQVRARSPAALYALAMIAGFLVATPYALLDYPTFLTDLRFDFTHLSEGHAGVALERGWRYHLTHSLPFGTGASMFVTALAGVVAMLRRHARVSLPLVGFALVFYLAIGSGYTVFYRYILPLVPLVCLSAAVFVVDAAPSIARRARLSNHRALLLIVVAVATPSLVAAVWMDVLLGRTDTRVLAAEWLNERIQPDDTLFDAGGGYTHLMIWRPFHRVKYDEATNQFDGDLTGLPDWLVLYRSPLRAYTGAPAALRTVAATKYRLAHSVDATRGLAALAEYDRQDAFFLPFSRFNTVVRPGPTVLIYRRLD